jgi:hypothetical protein
MNMRSEDETDAEELGHEPITISARAVTKGFVVLFALVFAALLLMAGLMAFFTRLGGSRATVDAPDAPVATPPAGVPMLDSNQRGSLRALRAKERQVLTEYAWVAPDNSVARIPIKRAMEIISQRPAPDLEPQQ